MAKIVHLLLAAMVLTCPYLCGAGLCGPRAGEGSLPSGSDSCGDQSAPTHEPKPNGSAPCGCICGGAIFLKADVTDLRLDATEFIATADDEIADGDAAARAASAAAPNDHLAAPLSGRHLRALISSLVC
ncbi:MAG: hypothetical protein HYS13_20010 [Planctomycetia bacterium]|nr:hypothetical protein [Planctomycetia bacterium]